MKQTLTPIEPPYASNIEAILKNYPKQQGYLLKLFRVFANSERFLLKGMPKLLDKDSPISLREREIVILRVCANNACEYKWGVHVTIFSQYANLSSEQVINTTQAEIDRAAWSDKDVILLQVIDQLTASGVLMPETHDQFQQHWSAQQQLEMFALCGSYQTVSYVANHAEVSLEDFASRFPA